MAQGYILNDQTLHAYTNQQAGALFATLAGVQGRAGALDIPVGSLLLCHSGDGTGNGGATFDGGWKRIDPDANVHDNLLLGRIATGNDPGPNIKWPSAATFIQRGAQIGVFTGDVWPDINTIVSGTADRGTNSTNAVSYAGCTVADDFSLLIAVGRRFKTVTADGSTWGAMQDLNPWVIVPSTTGVQNGTGLGMVMNYWQQATKANTTLTAQILSIQDAAGNAQGTVIALKSQIAAGGLALLNDRSMRGEL